MGAFCLLASAGAQLARSSGFSQPAEKSSAYSALGARLALEIPASRRLKVRLHADLLAALTRADLVVADQVAFRPEVVSISLGAALNARVW